MKKLLVLVVGVFSQWAGCWAGDFAWKPMGTTGAPNIMTMDSLSIQVGSKWLLIGDNADGSGSRVGAFYDPVANIWSQMDMTDAPDITMLPEAVSVWTGSKVLLMGDSATGQGVTGALYDPSAKTWIPMSTNGLPDVMMMDAQSVWTGSKLLMIGNSMSDPEAKSGASYDPVSNKWTAISMTGAPDIMLMESESVWVGSKWLLMGDSSTNPESKVGALYDPALKKWTAMNMSGFPDIMQIAWAVWTGSKWMVVGESNEDLCLTGALYNPVANTWVAMNMTGAPELMMMEAQSTWTGSKWLLMGDSMMDPMTKVGGVYDPALNKWTAMNTTGAPNIMMSLASGWTGTRWLLMGDSMMNPDTKTGALYDPVLNKWTAMDMTGAPDLMIGMMAKSWTGSKLLLFGDSNMDPNEKVGGLYDPTANSWASMRTKNLPNIIPAVNHVSVWTASKWLFLNTLGSMSLEGDIYNPVDDTVTEMNMTGAPNIMMIGSSVWTGSRLLLIGDGMTGNKRGGLYNPVSNAWTSMNMAGAPNISMMPGAGVLSIWTGSKWLLLGDDVMNPEEKAGSLYDLSADIWTSMDMTGAPDVALMDAKSVWTGSKLLLMGDSAVDPEAELGAAYDPASNIWTAINMTGSPDIVMMEAKSVWTGSKWLLLGDDAMSPEVKTGALYDPLTDAWTSMDMTGVQDIMMLDAKSVWTGSQWLLMGNSVVDPAAKLGAAYDPASNIWTAINMTGSPDIIMMAAESVWTGSKWLLLGDDAMNPEEKTGALYDPSTDTWKSMDMTGVPDIMMLDAESVWTGSSLLLLGSSLSGVGLAGGRYSDDTQYFTLTVNSGTGGSAYTNGTKVTITADTLAGKNFDRWTGAVQYLSAVTSSPAVVTMPATNIMLTATYKVAYYALTVAGGTGGGSYTNGQKVTIRATVSAGMKFVDWNDGNTNASYSITMPPTPITYTANFADIQKPTITVATPLAKTMNESLTVRGTAADNKAVASVWVQVNSNGWTQAIGTNSWTNTVTLTAGPNTIRAYSVDAANNCSATSSVICTYAVSGRLTITTNGPGTVARTPTTPVEIGQIYTLTATPGAGYGLKSWGGDVSGTNKVVMVKATSNTVVIANFADNVKPMVTIKLPAAALKVSNAVYVVCGTATDNKAVASVWVQVNSNGWTQAIDTNSWTSTVTLTAGPNTIRAYSVDAANNCSVTSSVVCTYKVSGSLTITTNGLGTVARTPTTAVEIGQTYTLTATPGAGHGLQSWGGDASGTNKVVKVTATSNTTVVANFADNVNPVVTITDPKAAQRVSNSVYVVKGTATDNMGVSNVLCRVNGGAWTNAVSTNSWKAWSVPVELSDGSNSVQACCIDTARNISFANVGCTYVVTARLTVETTGSGTVTPNLNGQPLEIGKSYTMTAAPAAGAVFVDWTDGNGEVVTNKPIITFTMQPKLMLTANFSTLLDLSEEGLSALSEFLDTNSVPQGDTQLIADAALAFDLAARSNPNNYTNRIYNAVTIIMNLVNNPVVRAQAEAYGMNLDDLLDPTCIFPTNAPSVDASVDQFAAVVLPAIDKAWAELNAVPATWSGRVEISTNRFPSFDESVCIDVGDVAALKAALKGLRAFTGVLKAYNLNVNYARIHDPVVTPQKAITVDGSAADWANVPRSLVTFDYEDGMGTSFAVTQEVAVVLDGTNIALLVTGCPFEISNDFLIDFDLSLSDGNAINTNREHYIRLGPSASVIYGTDNDNGIVGLEASLVDGVLEIKFPVQDEQATSQVTIEEVGCAMDFGGYWNDIFWVEPPSDTPIPTLRVNHPEFFSKVRNQASLTGAKTDLQAALNGYLAADTLIGKRSTDDVSLHLVDFDPTDPEAVEDRQDQRLVIGAMLSSLSAPVPLEGDSDIEGTLTRPVFLGALFSGKITTNMLPLGLKGTLNNPDWTVFPDPTLGGTLPGMTATNLNKYMRGYTWASVETMHNFTTSKWTSAYELQFSVGTDRENMTITNVTVSGSGVPLTNLELRDDWWTSCAVPSALAVGTPYTFTVYFADGSREVIIDKINAWITVAPTPSLTGTVLRWNNVSASVPNADHYAVYTSNGSRRELPLTQTSIDLSEFGYVVGNSCWFEVEIVNKNWDKASRSGTYQGVD